MNGLIVSGIDQSEDYNELELTPIWSNTQSNKIWEYLYGKVIFSKIFDGKLLFLFNLIIFLKIYSDCSYILCVMFRVAYQECISKGVL